jgi:hypothetical protein
MTEIARALKYSKDALMPDVHFCHRAKGERANWSSVCFMNRCTIHFKVIGNQIHGRERGLSFDGMHPSCVFDALFPRRFYSTAHLLRSLIADGIKGCPENIH